MPWYRLYLIKVASGYGAAALRAIMQRTQMGAYNPSNTLPPNLANRAALNMLGGRTEPKQLIQQLGSAARARMPGLSAAQVEQRLNSSSGTAPLLELIRGSRSPAQTAVLAAPPTPPQVQPVVAKGWEQLLNAIRKRQPQSVDVRATTSVMLPASAAARR